MAGDRTFVVQPDRRGLLRRGQAGAVDHRLGLVHAESLVLLTRC
jgi:hypothetical protein